MCPLEELTAEGAIVRAGVEKGQSKGETLTLMLRLQLRAKVLNLNQHPTPLLALGGLLAISLGPAGAGCVSMRGGGNSPLRWGIGCQSLPRW